MEMITINKKTGIFIKQEFERIQQERDKYKEVIDKAIEYIEEAIKYPRGMGLEPLDEMYAENIVDILKGEYDNE